MTQIRLLIVTALHIAASRFHVLLVAVWYFFSNGHSDEDKMGGLRSRWPNLCAA
jgi:hypothetical protein